MKKTGSLGVLHFAMRFRLTKEPFYNGHIMKKVLFLFSGAVFIVGTAFGQYVKVFVRSGDTALPFAFVSVNNRYRATADSLGTAHFDQSVIRVGDTVSANYFGQQASTAYDGSGRVEISIDALEIDAVTVSERFKWWKHIKYPQIRDGRHTICGRFEVEIEGSGLKVAGTGRYTAVSLPGTDKSRKYFVKDELTYSTVDTLPDREVRELGATILNHASLAVGLYPYAWQNRGLSITPAGPAKDDIRPYLVSRPATREQNEYRVLNVATTLYVDAATKRIVGASGRLEYTDRSIGFDASYGLTDGITHPTEIAARAVIKQTGQEVTYRFSGLQITKRDKKRMEAGN